MPGRAGGRGRGRRAGRGRGGQGHLAGRSLSARPAVLGPGGAAVPLRPADPRPQAHRRAVRVRLPAMYKPAAKRRWGYFALPILSGDRLAGKLDATADRDAAVLRVRAIHQDVPFTKAMAADIQREISSLAEWLKLDLALPG
ncbi:MAG TPA: crosslink repair DNA glycosylase YcaQ family protein [Streptosporangiaceae bacterium]|nr:crosslink repair DNA glycosylase YcaQ family protein [Streptosporangiaceae bacterium]